MKIGIAYELAPDFRTCDELFFEDVLIKKKKNKTTTAVFFQTNIFSLENLYEQREGFL